MARWQAKEKRWFIANHTPETDGVDVAEVGTLAEQRNDCMETQEWEILPFFAITRLC